jgi:DnaJ-class molecular chaperone
VPTLTGPVTVEIPRRRHHGAKLRLRGKGVPGEAGRPGDQIVTVIVETPRATAGLADALDALERAVQADPQALPKRSAQRG